LKIGGDGFTKAGFELNTPPNGGGNRPGECMIPFKDIRLRIFLDGYHWPPETPTVLTRVFLYKVPRNHLMGED